MAEINGSLQGTHALQALFHALDPISLLVSDDQPIIPASLIPDTDTDTDTYFVVERGPRYGAYAELREAQKLRRKLLRQPEPDKYNNHDQIQTPLRRQVKFQENPVCGRKGSSIMTRSVPDFSSVIRKENRKPMNTLSPLLEMTPPSKNWPKVNAASSSAARGSKSANAGEKKKGGLMVRKSYACLDELKGMSSMSMGGDRGRNLRGTRRTVLGSRPI